MNKELLNKALSYAGDDPKRVEIVVNLFGFMNKRDELIEICAINVGRLHIEAYNLMPNDDSSYFDEQKHDDLIAERDIYLEIIKQI